MKVNEMSMPTSMPMPMPRRRRGITSPQPPSARGSLPMFWAVLLAIAPLYAEGLRRLPDDFFFAVDGSESVREDDIGRARRLSSETNASTEGAGLINSLLGGSGGDDERPNRRRRDARRDQQGADAHLVTSLPLLDSFPTAHWAGHLPASPPGSDGIVDKELFYWLFAPDDGRGGGGDGLAADDVPLVIWMNGGPGCSSMDGMWLENGPFRLTKPSEGKQWMIKINDFSWHKIPAFVLYIDQPVGTGLSFTKSGNYCESDLEVDVDFHYFLQEFLLFHGDKFLRPMNDGDRSKLPQLSETVESILRRPLYFSGESHAGHFIPSMMDHILRRQDGSLSDADSHAPPLRTMIPLGGAAIGNGWMDPFRQYAAADAAYGHGLVDNAQRAALDEKELACQELLKGGHLHSGVCFDLLDAVVDQSGGHSGNFKVSRYDTRLWEPKGQARTFPMGHKDVETYLGGAASRERPPLEVDHRQVLEAIHAGEAIVAGQVYQECTDPPYLALAKQDGLGVVDEVVRILNHPTTPALLFFNGVNDLICNHVGNEKFLDSLPWSKAKAFMAQSRYAWYAENGSPRPDGYAKSYENLSFLKVMDAGHMVPMDQPSVSLAMIRTLVLSGSGEGFLRSEQELKRSDPTTGENMCSLAMCPNCNKRVFPLDVDVTSTSFLKTAELAVISFLSFVLGAIISLMCQRRKKIRQSAARNDNLELTVLDDDDDDGSTYRDRPAAADFT